jgi:hypothetical protein
LGAVGAASASLLAAAAAAPPLLRVLLLPLLWLLLLLLLIPLLLLPLLLLLCAAATCSHRQQPLQRIGRAPRALLPQVAHADAHQAHLDRQLGLRVEGFGLGQQRGCAVDRRGELRGG